MKRTQTVLAALLGFQVLLIFLFRGVLAESMGPVESRTLLPGLESFSPAKIDIQGPEGKQVTLVHEGERWGLEQAGGYPADEKKVEDFLSKLQKVKVRQPVVTSSRYHEALKVSQDQFERHVRIWEKASEDAKLGFFLGSSPNYRIIHVRLEGDDRVYEVAGLGAWDANDSLNSWADLQLVDVQTDRITKFSLQNPEGAFEIEKDSKGNWSLVGSKQKLDKTKVDSLVRSAATLRAGEPAGVLDRGAQGFANPAATVVLRVEKKQEGEETVENESEEVTIWIGKPVEGEDGKRYITRSGFEFAGIASQYSIENFLTQKIADLQ